jgi:uncharacterized membrane protein
MKFHPIIFVLIAYGITVVIALCVYCIVKIIAFFVRRKENTPAPSAGTDNKGGTAS